MLAEVLWSRFIFLALFCYLYIRPYERSPRILIWDEPRTAGSNSPSTHRKLHLLSMQPNFHRSTQFRYFGYPTPYLWYEVALGVEYHDWSCHTAFDPPSLQSKVLLRPWVRGKSQDESKRLARMRCRKETSPRTQLLKHASGLCILSPVMKNFLPPMSVIANKEGLCNRTVLSLEKPHGIVRSYGSTYVVLIAFLGLTLHNYVSKQYSGHIMAVSWQNPACFIMIKLNAWLFWLITMSCTLSWIGTKVAMAAQISPRFIISFPPILAPPPILSGMITSILYFWTNQRQKPSS